MKDLVVIGVLSILLLLILLVGVQTEAFTTVRPAPVPVPLSNGEELPLPDDCTQGLYKCVTHRIPFGF